MGKKSKEANDQLPGFPRPPKQQSTAGTDTEVLLNVFRISDLTCKHIYAYKVTVTGAKHVPAAIKGELVKAVAASTDRYMVYDGGEFIYAPKSIIGKKDAVGDELKKTVPRMFGRPETMHEFEVSISMHRRYETKILKKYCSGDRSIPETYIHDMLFALDRIFRHYPMSQLRVMGNCCVTDFEKVKTGAGFDIWWGFRQTVKAGQGSLFLSIHTKPVPVISSRLLQNMAMDFFRSKRVSSLDELQISDWQRLVPVLRNVRFKVPGSNTSAWISGFSPVPAGKVKIDGVPIAEWYGADIDTRLPCAKTAMGTMVPVELCEVVPDQMLPRVSGYQQSQMFRCGSLGPQERQAITEHGIKFLDTANNPDLQAFGITVGQDLEKFSARVLETPQLRFGDNAAMTPLYAHWQLNNKKVIEGKQLVSWAIVCFANQRMVPQSMVSAFVNQLAKTCGKIGVQVSNISPPINHASVNCSVESEIRRACQAAETQSQMPVQLVMCVLPANSLARYGEIKRVATTVVGVMTQCLLANNVRQGNNPKYATLVGLKINAKLGGFTAGLDASDMPGIDSTMVISADVNHTTEAGNMSVAAILSSVDLECRRFSGTVLQHPKKMEFIENFDVIVRQCLRIFYSHTKRKPKRIIYYRDGIGDSVLQTVKQLELEAIYKGCELVEPGYRPKVTMVIVRKRHHTRMLPAPGQVKCTEVDGNGNCLPGTVVEQGVVNPCLFDFYLLAHVSTVGTSRPAYYMVLHDDNKFSVEDIQRLTYNLSYMYPIVPKAATMPAPIYYAHRLTGQGRFHTSIPFDQLPKFTGKRANDISLVSVHRNLESGMYFM